jgi:hypothetical protein
MVFCESVDVRDGLVGEETPDAMTLDVLRIGLRGVGDQNVQPGTPENGVGPAQRSEQPLELVKPAGEIRKHGVMGDEDVHSVVCSSLIGHRRSNRNP